MAKNDLAQNAIFFDQLVDLVPAKYYHPSDKEVVNTKYLKKNAKAAAKQAMKEQYKQNKRAKLNPDTAKTSLQIQQQQAEKLKQSDDSEEDEDDMPPQAPQQSSAQQLQRPAQEQKPEPVKTLQLPAGDALSHSDLQQKLQQRLQKLRDQRHADEEAKQPGKGRKKSKDKSKQKEPQSVSTAAAAKAWRHGQLTADKGKKRQADDQDHGGVKRQKQAAAKADQQGELQFGRVEMGQTGQLSKQQNKKKKPTKEQLLQEAVQKQKQKSDNSADTRGKVKQEAWKSALSRARGEKVLDDPKLLRKSMKKDAKLKEKKSNAWKQRQGEQKQAQAKKQKRRQDNLQGRADTKKANRIEKREKKLMRAGFEGRRSSFINS